MRVCLNFPSTNPEKCKNFNDKQSKKLREVKKNISDLFVRYPYHPCDWWIYPHENHKKLPKYTSFMDGMGYEFADTGLQKTFL